MHILPPVLASIEALHWMHIRFLLKRKLMFLLFTASIQPGSLLMYLTKIIWIPPIGLETQVKHELKCSDHCILCIMYKQARESGIDKNEEMESLDIVYIKNAWKWESSF